MRRTTLAPARSARRAVRLSTLSVQNAPGLTIDPTVSALNVNRINAFYGGITNADKSASAPGDALPPVVQRGATGIAFHGGNLDLAPTLQHRRAAD